MVGPLGATQELGIGFLSGTPARRLSRLINIITIRGSEIVVMNLFANTIKNVGLFLFNFCGVPAFAGILWSLGKIH
jgi:hypothetical protein